MYHIFETSDVASKAIAAAKYVLLNTNVYIPAMYYLFLLSLNYSEAVKAANIELSTAPAELKCELSHTLLREAVSMPCCNRLVNDSIIRDTLVREGLKCPFCGTPRISPESVCWLLLFFRNENF